jgi:putative copper export protein
MLIPTWYYLNLFVHPVAVSLWLGLTVNFSVMTVPLLRDLPEQQADRQLTEIRRRARRLVIVLIVILLLTGLVILYRGSYLHGHTGERGLMV